MGKTLPTTRSSQGTPLRPRLALLLSVVLLLVCSSHYGTLGIARGQTSSGDDAVGLFFLVGEPRDLGALKNVLRDEVVTAALDDAFSVGPCVSIAMQRLVINATGDREYRLGFRFFDAASGNLRQISVTYTNLAASGADPVMPPDSCTVVTADTTATGSAPRTVFANPMSIEFLRYVLADGNIDSVKRILSRAAILGLWVREETASGGKTVFHLDLLVLEAGRLRRKTIAADGTDGGGFGPLRALK